MKKNLKENQALEFKKSLAEKEEILETISAFGTAKGGKILVGIEENKDGTIKEITGIEIKGKVIENITNEIKQNIDPVIFPSIEIKELEGKEVLSIEIEENPLTLDMINECRKWGIPEPEFEFIGTSLVVIFKKPLAREKLLESSLNERQIKAVGYVERNKKIDRRTYCSFYDVKKTFAHKELNGLVEKGIFEKVGKGRATYYILKRPLSGRLADNSLLYKNRAKK